MVFGRIYWKERDVDRDENGRRSSFDSALPYKACDVEVTAQSPVGTPRVSNNPTRNVGIVSDAPAQDDYGSILLSCICIAGIPVVDIAPKNRISSVRISQ